MRYSEPRVLLRSPASTERMADLYSHLVTCVEVFVLLFSSEYKCLIKTSEVFLTSLISH